MNRLISFLVNASFLASVLHGQKHAFISKRELLAGKSRIVVSFTTIDSRVLNLKPIIESILTQTLLPDRFELYISDHPSQFEGGIDNGIRPEHIPSFLQDYQRNGQVHIEYVDNIGPSRKLIPALKKYWNTDTFIVTIDDDVTYSKDFIETLLRLYNQYHGTIGFLGRHINKREQIFLKEPFGERIKNDFVVSDGGYISGTLGILYRPEFFDERVFDTETLLKLCPKHDDVWFYFMRLFKGYPSFVCKSYRPFNSLVKYENCLYKMNKFTTKEGIKRVARYFGFPVEDSDQKNSATQNPNT